MIFVHRLSNCVKGVSRNASDRETFSPFTLSRSTSATAGIIFKRFPSEYVIWEIRQSDWSIPWQRFRGAEADIEEQNQQAGVHRIGGLGCRD